MLSELELSDLRKLREATDAAITAVAQRDIRGSVNWGDLGCVEAAIVFDDTGDHYYRVLIEEASPDAHEFIAAVMAELKRSEWRFVQVATQW